MSLRLGLAIAIPALAPGSAQSIPKGTVGWYNGDWRQAIPGIADWHASDKSFARAYDDFVVPESGWTVTGAFAHVSMRPEGVTQAFWEIRSDASAGLGNVVASGVGAATLTKGTAVGNGLYLCLVEVSGLWAPLPAGHYWLTVAPVTTDHQTYLSATVGVNSVGTSAETKDGAFLLGPAGKTLSSAHTSGTGGSTGDYSLGILVTAAPASINDAWRWNLSSLKEQMLANHGQPFPGVDVEDWVHSVDELAARIPDLSDAEARTGIQALVASIGAPHTDVGWPSPRPYRTLPFSLYWFDDGVYITAAPESLSGLLGAKLTGLGISSLDEAIAKLTPLPPTITIPG